MPIRYLHDALAPFYTAQTDVDDHEHDGAADKPSAHRCGLGRIMRQRDSEKLKQDGCCAGVLTFNFMMERTSEKAGRLGDDKKPRLGIATGAERGIPCERENARGMNGEVCAVEVARESAEKELD